MPITTHISCLHARIQIPCDHLAGHVLRNLHQEYSKPPGYDMDARVTDGNSHVMVWHEGRDND